VRLGSLWQLEAVHHASACLTAAYVGDALGLKRHIEALARQVAAGMNYRAHLDLARGEYAKLRGDLEGALRAIDSGIAALPPDEGLVRPWALAAKAETLLALGDVVAAIVYARETVKVSEDPEYGQLSFRYRGLRVLALAESAAGDREVAAARLDSAIEQAEALGNPLILGMLHEARVQVALASGNEVAAAANAQKVEFWFRPTRNPVLIARWERLERVLQPPPDPNAESSANDVVTEMLGAETVHHDTIAEVLSILSDCRTANARAQRALELLVEASGARGGLLYVAKHGHLALAAPGHGTEPPAELVRAAMDRYARVHESPDTMALGLEDVGGAPTTSGWSTGVLAFTRDGRTQLVGIVLLRASERGLTLPGETLVEAIAHRLAEDQHAAAASVSVSRP
jgi:tetratricopeptide (TPR) repeat protein